LAFTVVVTVLEVIAGTLVLVAVPWLLIVPRVLGAVTFRRNGTNWFIPRSPTLQDTVIWPLAPEVAVQPLGRGARSVTPEGN
jgi:hypothetical protein